MSSRRATSAHTEGSSWWRAFFFFFFPKPKDFDFGLLNLSAGTTVALRNSG